MDWQEVLQNYRGKDMIEKAFDILKNDIELYTPHVHKENTLRGITFYKFSVSYTEDEINEVDEGMRFV